MLWEHSGLDFEIRMEMAPLGVKDRLAEHGIVTPETKLPTIRSLPENKIKLGDKETAIIYLYIKNKSKKSVRFSVAPHGTEPAETSLGFHFNCLCNGHVYEVAPGKVWYRIMQLKTSEQLPPEKVQLKHVIFEVKKNTKLKAHH